MSMACLTEIHTNMKNPKNGGMIAMEYIMQMNNLYIGMTILRVFQVTYPILPLLGRVWEHSNWGWDGFVFGAGSGFVIIYLTPSLLGCEITSVPLTYKYLPQFQLSFLILGFLFLFIIRVVVHPTQCKNRYDNLISSISSLDSSLSIA